MIDAIIQEALHSQQFGTLTNIELWAILKIVEHAKNDLDKNDGNRSKNAYDDKIDLSINGVVQG